MPRVLASLHYSTDQPSHTPKLRMVIDDKADRRRLLVMLASVRDYWKLTPLSARVKDGGMHVNRWNLANFASL